MIFIFLAITALIVIMATPSLLAQWFRDHTPKAPGLSGAPAFFRNVEEILDRRRKERSVFLIQSDELGHASMLKGTKVSLAAVKSTSKHIDVDNFRETLQNVLDTNLSSKRPRETS